MPRVRAGRRGGAVHCSAAFALEAAAGGACEGLVEFKTRGVNMIKVSVRGGGGGGGGGGAAVAR